MRAPRRVLLVVVVAALVGLGAVGCTPTPGGGTTTTAAPSTWTAGACPSGRGVTVVVDFADLGRAPVARCALGAQASGLVALATAGFTAVGEPGVAPVCQIQGLPAQGFPFCWYTGGYWSYWTAPARGAEWSFATTGPGAGPVAEGTVQGWAWAPGFVSDGPRLRSDGT